VDAFYDHVYLVIATDELNSERGSMEALAGRVAGVGRLVKAVRGGVHEPSGRHFTLKEVAEISGLQATSARSFVRTA